MHSHFGRSTVLFCCALAIHACAGEWPAWRGDAGRTADSPHALPAKLHLRWTRELPKPKACWPWTQYRLQFDASYEPIVVGKRLIVPSMVRDCVTAYDTDTGQELWRRYVDGPVRFAPAAWRGKLYFVCDDGYLYCLDIATGRQLWRLRGAPSERKVLGNERLVSMWPARGAPVVYEGVVYFAASVWPFMGTFIYAVDADTGKVIWCNSGSGAVYVLQPHHSPAFAGVAPQGYLAANGDKLLVAGSRSVPGVYDRRTGKFLYYQANTSKAAGGYDVATRGEWFFNANIMYRLADGAALVPMPASVLTAKEVIGADGRGGIVAHKLGSPRQRKIQKVQRRTGKKYFATVLEPVVRWRATCEPSVSRVFLKAGDRLYCAAGGGVAAIETPHVPELVERSMPAASAASQTLIPQAAAWRYLAGSHPKGAWTTLGYDATSWRIGRPGFGYGDGDDTTVLKHMPGQYTTVYIRKTFRMRKTDAPATLSLSINYDDAFIAYLNGKEVLRVGVRSGAGPAAKGIKSHEAKGYETFAIANARSLLRKGNNVLAIEGHNRGLTSSDFSLDPYLTTQPPSAKPQAAPVVQARVAWQASVDGKPWSMVAGDDKLFVVTQEGKLYCYGARGGQVRRRTLADKPRGAKREPKVARRILSRTGVSRGYCLVLGLGSGRLAEGLARSGGIRVIGLDPDAAKIEKLRRKFDDMGLYGERATFLRGDIQTLELPAYMARLIVSEDIDASGYTRKGFAKRLFRVLRPYGGVASLPVPAEEQAAFIRMLQRAALPNAKIEAVDGRVQLARVGALPGSADWTHQYGDVANTVCSRDKLVKAPLGLLWFGGPSYLDVLPRHGHGPMPQIVAGRLFLEGLAGLKKRPSYPTVLSARDVYTGRVLWRREFADVDTSDMYYNGTYNPDPRDRTYNQRHMPGANQYGTNYVATADEVYLVRGSGCLVLDAATGEIQRTIKLPKIDGQRPNWGYIGVYRDLLIAGAAPLAVGKQALLNHRYGVGSRYLVVLDRRTGRALWTRKAGLNFRHNCIVAGGGRIFCLDGMSRQRLDFLRRRRLAYDPQAKKGRAARPLLVTAAARPQLLALDARSGDVVWSVDEGVFGTWLGYSEEYDVLLQAGSRAGDRARDETAVGMAAYAGSDGRLLWRHKEAYSGPPILRHEMIITQTGGGNLSARPAKVYALRTGKLVTRTHPMTGETIPWNWVRFKGCNTAIASEHLMTFRSASACYLDFHAGQGTISIGGFKSGCTSNLVAANGVLNAPDYTRTCLCAYQNQSSLALVPMDEVEQWSFDYYPAPAKQTPVVRLGINLGAPGNRTAPDGTLWLEYPSVGGPSPDVPILEEPRGFETARVHSSLVQGRLPWVAASGLKGAGVLRIRPFVQPAPGKAKAVTAADRSAYAPLRWEGKTILGAFDKPRRYTVRLYFAELEGKQPGERIFSVSLQGREVLSNFDIAAAAGGVGRAVVREVRGVEVADDLVVSLSATQELPLLSGIELVAEQ